MEEGGISVIQEAGTSCGRGKVGCFQDHDYYDDDFYDDFYDDYYAGHKMLIVEALKDYILNSRTRTAMG